MSLKEVKAYVRTSRLPFILMGLSKLEDFPGVSVYEVRGFGREASDKSHQRLVEFVMEANRYVKLEIICEEAGLEGILAVIQEQAMTKEGSDGKIFVSHIDQVLSAEIGTGGAKP